MDQWTVRGLVNMLWEFGPSTLQELEFLVTNGGKGTTSAIDKGLQAGLVTWRGNRLDLTEAAVNLQVGDLNFLVGTEADALAVAA